MNVVLLMRLVLLVAAAATVAMACWSICNYALDILPLAKRVSPHDQGTLSWFTIHASISGVAVAVQVNTIYSLVKGVPGSPLLFLTAAAFAYQFYAVFKFYRGYRRLLSVAITRMVLLDQLKSDRLDADWDRKDVAK